MKYDARTQLTGTPLAGRVSQWGHRGFIKSVQRGSITINTTTSTAATITAVDINNSVLVFGGQTYTVSLDQSQYAIGRLEFTNATTVTGYVNTSPSVAGNSGVLTFQYTVIEYYPGVIKSVQRGTIAATTAGVTGTITTVDITKSRCDYLGLTTPQASVFIIQGRVVLTNATTVTATTGNASGTVGYQVVEFY